MIVADSDVLIDFLRGREPGMTSVRSEISTGRLATTAVNCFELLSGAQTRAQLSKVSDLLAALIVLPVDEEAGMQAAEVRRKLEEKGEGIGMADYLIAGVCLCHQATLLTRNLEHFSRVPALKVIDPAG